MSPARYSHGSLRRPWKGHLGLYQAMTAVFTPQYQSSSRILPWMRARILAPLSRVAPLPRVLTAIVSGDILPPIAGSRFPDIAWTSPPIGLKSLASKRENP